MKRACEQEEGQHPVERGRLEINLSDGPREAIVGNETGKNELDPNQDK